MTWLDAGTRNFYTINKPIEKPGDLKGLKIRVQQSPTNIEMMRLLGGSATPMGFGDVYTALQSGIIDGAEDKRWPWTAQRPRRYLQILFLRHAPDGAGHTDRQQRLHGKPVRGGRAVFEEGFKLVNQVEREEWVKAVENAKERAQNDPAGAVCVPGPAALCGGVQTTARDRDRQQSGAAAHL